MCDPACTGSQVGGDQSKKLQVTVVRAATESTQRASATPGGQALALRRDCERDVMGQKELVCVGGRWVGNRGRVWG